MVFELGPVEKGAGIVNRHQIGGTGTPSGPLLDDQVLESGLRRLHAGLLLVLREKGVSLLAVLLFGGFLHLGPDLVHHLHELGTEFRGLLGGELRIFAMDSVTHALEEGIEFELVFEDLHLHSNADAECVADLLHVPLGSFGLGGLGGGILRGARQADSGQDDCDPGGFQLHDCLLNPGGRDRLSVWRRPVPAGLPSGSSRISPRS